MVDVVFVFSLQSTSLLVNAELTEINAKCNFRKLHLQYKNC